ncbi:nucleic acid/nucleotide deaminase domain-containing protein [Streptomyces sirii]
MYPMEHQANLRDSNDVRQVDTDVPYRRMSEWAEIPKNAKPPATQSPLAAVLNRCVPTPDENGVPRYPLLRRRDLIDALPGFDTLHPGEQGAVVAAMARMSHSYHAAHAVGMSPEPRDHPYANDKDKDGNPIPQGANVTTSPPVVAHQSNQWPTASRQDADLKQAIKDAFGQAGFSGALNASGDHRPDFTGRNYAVVEVYDPKTKETSFVVDSSFGNDAPIPGKHSEPHILDYLDSLDAGRKDGEKYERLSLYTDREPCGRGQGLANCSDTLRERIPGVDVYYATEYRKNAETVPEEVPAGTTRKKLNDGAHVANMLEIGKLWVKVKHQGGL